MKERSNNYKNENEEDIKSAALTIGGGSLIFNKKLEKYNKLLKKTNDIVDKHSLEESEKGRKETRKNLLKRAKKNNIDVIEHSGWNNVYIPSKKLIKDLDSEARIKLSGKTGVNYFDLEKNIDKSKGGGIVAISKKRKENNNSTLSHELGHAELSEGIGKNRSLIGSIIHKKPIQHLDRVTKNLGPITLGIRAGIKDEDDRKKEKITGEKNNKHRFVKAAAGSLLFLAPIFAREATASRRGIEMMKEVGASKEELDAAKKTLKSAFRTYEAYEIPKNLKISTGSYLVGRGIGKVKDPPKNKKDDNKKEKD